MKREKKDFVIFNKILAEELIQAGFKLLRVAPARKNKKMLVFFFENSNELVDKLNELRPKKF